jgi:hypothetical protein
MTRNLVVLHVDKQCAACIAPMLVENSLKKFEVSNELKGIEDSYL